MDLVTILGFAVAIALVLAGAMVEGLHLSALIGPTAFMIVMGGTLGATAMSHTKEDLKLLGGALKRTIMPVKLDFSGTIDYIVNLAEKARRNGLLSLQEDVATAPHPLISTGLTMAVDGTDPDTVRQVLTAVAKLEEHHLHSAAAVCDTAGGYCPTLGIMGTVMGMIHIMGNLSDPDSLGPSIAVAFLATFYGVAFANVLFLPLGSKIKLLAHQELQFSEMIVEGLIGLQSGSNPRTLRERLAIYQGSHAKHDGKAKKDDKGKAGEE